MKIWIIFNFIIEVNCTSITVTYKGSGFFFLAKYTFPPYGKFESQSGSSVSGGIKRCRTPDIPILSETAMIHVRFGNWILQRHLSIVILVAMTVLFSNKRDQ